MTSLRRFRVDAGLDVDELATRSGVTESVIYRIENGSTRRPGVDKLNALASALSDALPDGTVVQPSDIDPLLAQEAA